MAIRSAKRPTPNPLYGEQASRRVLAHLLTEFERARDERDAAQARMDRFVETITLLIDGLPAHERTEHNQRLEVIRRGAPQRGSQLYGNVIALFKRDQRLEWTVPDAKASLEQSGVRVDTKALTNIFVYLRNTGRLQRIERGRYVVTGGIGIETADELAPPDGTRRITEHDV
jgi:hypothetical protein